MVKFLKISPTGHISECNDLFRDKDFIDMETDGCVLCHPEKWKHNKYSLTMFVQCYSDELNPVASVLFNHLYLNSMIDEEIHGWVFLANENKKGEVDMTFDDFSYLWSKIKDMRVKPLPDYIMT